MVLGTAQGGAGAAGAPRRCPSGASGEEGSQTLEFALVLPLVALLLTVGLHAGIAAVDLVAAQGFAREAARAAAVADDEEARQRLRAAAGERPVRLVLDPASPRSPGTLVTARVEVASRAFRPFGLDVWLPATAVMRVEDG